MQERENVLDLLDYFMNVRIYNQMPQTIQKADLTGRLFAVAFERELSLSTLLLQRFYMRELEKHEHQRSPDRR